MNGIIDVITSSNDSQPSNASDFILLIVLGIITLFRFVQFINALYPIDSTPSYIITSFNDLQ